MSYRIGIELELLAPVGSTRATLAEAIATKVDGEVITNWYLGSERSRRRPNDIVNHLTPAFDVADSDGKHVVRIVDDATIHKDLDFKAPSPPGWSRIMSDDARFLRMLEHRIPPSQRSNLEELQPLVAGYGLEVADNGRALRFQDSAGMAVALHCNVPRDRPRVAECISPPLESGVDEWFALIGETAAELDFTVPHESATHFHYDGDTFRDPVVFRRLVRTFSGDIEPIRTQFETNPACRRLGALPNSVLAVVNSDDYAALSWPEIAERCRATKDVVKWADVNISKLILVDHKLDTVEFRMLPGSLSVEQLQFMRMSTDSLVDALRANPD